MTEQEAIQNLWEGFHPDYDSYETFCKVASETLKAYADAQSTAKDAEIKRLREGIGEEIEIVKDHTYLSNPEFVKRYKKQLKRLKALLSPTPVTESRPPISLQMYKCNNCQWRGQVGESIETESFDICPECKSDDLML